MENLKVRECLKALEREKIAKGMQCSKEDELRLREVQKMQIYEKRCIEQEEADRDSMWHQVLLNDVRRKEKRERLEAERRHREMLERRKTYDEQIASANKKRREALNEERDKERKKLDRIKQRMEEDYYAEIKTKKEQQLTNKTNFIEGHKQKLSRQWEEKCRERELDNKTIKVALEELREERLRKRNNILQQRNTEKIFTDNFNRERRNAEELDNLADKVTDEWREQEENRTDEFIRRVENERRMIKEKTMREYEKHLEKLKEETLLRIKQRSERMQLVSRNAYRELQRKVEHANGELKKQLEYRNTLKNQIIENNKALQSELSSTRSKDWSFTKKPEMFSDVMMNRYNQFADRQSTNPIHPFKKIIDTTETKKNTVHTINLPLIGNKYK